MFTESIPKLASFFYIIHPAQGKLPGPWTKIPDMKLKRLGLDVARVWTSLDPEVGPALRSVVDLAVAGSDLERYWMR